MQTSGFYSRKSIALLFHECESFTLITADMTLAIHQPVHLDVKIDYRNYYNDTFNFKRKVCVVHRSLEACSATTDVVHHHYLHLNLISLQSSCSSALSSKELAIQWNAQSKIGARIIYFRKQIFFLLTNSAIVKMMLYNC